MNKKVAIVAAIIIMAWIAVWKIASSETQPDTNTATNQSSETMAMHEQYPALPEGNHFVQQSSDEIIERFTNGTGVIFLGFKECPWCQKAAPLINEAAESEDVSVYYLDIREERENETPAYQELVRILTPYLPKDQNGEVRISTPDISFVKDGEIIGRNEIESTTEAERTPDTYWTNERKARAIARFNELMQELK